MRLARNFLTLVGGVVTSVVVVFLVLCAHELFYDEIKQRLRRGELSPVDDDFDDDEFDLDDDLELAHSERVADRYVDVEFEPQAEATA